MGLEQCEWKKANPKKRCLQGDGQRPIRNATGACHGDSCRDWVKGYTWDCCACLYKRNETVMVCHHLDPDSVSFCNHTKCSNCKVVKKEEKN